ncbi:DgyrCDS13446 [Dimorphilus gyrociliatus]|uniref:DgyrCDS13446 n=1 Tax=Dimorphilus gyrociliatus TaxID=2664684 RepID=A0A7I8WAP4_9ANNE|nr:DgyrCDS13446 [Dimorphilus gyrociliatus]
MILKAQWIFLIFYYLQWNSVVDGVLTDCNNCTSSNLQECKTVTGGFKCVCKSGFYGAYCSLKPLTISGCGTDSCNNCVDSEVESACPSTTSIYQSTPTTLEMTTTAVADSVQVIIDMLAAKKQELSPAAYQQLENQILQLILNSNKRRKRRAINDLEGKFSVSITNIEQVMNTQGEFVYRVILDFSSNDTSVTKATLEREITTDRVIAAAKKTFNNTEISAKQNDSRTLANSYSLFVRGFVLDKRVFKHYEHVIKGAFFNSQPSLKTRANFKVEVLRGEEYFGSKGESITKLYYFATYEENGQTVEVSPLEIEKPNDDHIQNEVKQKPELKEEPLEFADPSKLREIDSFFLLVNGIVYDVDEAKFANAIHIAYRTTLTTVNFNDIKVIISSRKTVIYEGKECTKLIYFLENTKTSEILSATIYQTVIESDVKISFTNIFNENYELIKDVRIERTTKTQIISEQEETSSTLLSLDKSFVFFSEIGVASDLLLKIQTSLEAVVRKNFELNTLDVDIVSTKRFAIPDRDNLITQISFFIKNGTKVLDARRFDSVKASVDEIATSVTPNINIIKIEPRRLEKTAVSIKSCFKQLIKGIVVIQDSKKFEEAFKTSILQANSELVKDETHIRLVSIQETLSEKGEKFSQLFFSAEEERVQIDASFRTKSEVSALSFKSHVTFKRRDKTSYEVSTEVNLKTSIYEDLRFFTSETRIVESDYTKIEEIYKTEIESQFTHYKSIVVNIVNQETVILKSKKRVTRVALFIQDTITKEIIESYKIASIKFESIKTKIGSITSNIVKKYSVSQLESEEKREETLFGFFLSTSVSKNTSLEETIATSIKNDVTLDIKKANVTVKIISINERINSKSEQMVTHVQYEVMINTRKISKKTSLQVSTTEITKEISKLTTSTGISYSVIKVDEKFVFKMEETHSFIVKNVIRKEIFQQLQQSLVKTVLKKVQNVQTSDISVKIINRLEVFSTEISQKITRVDFSISIKNQLISINEITKVSSTEIIQDLSVELSKKISIVQNINIEETVSVSKTFAITFKEKISKTEFSKINEVIKESLEAASITDVSSSVVTVEEVFQLETKTVLHSVRVIAKSKTEVLNAKVETLGDFVSVKKRIEEKNILTINSKKVSIVAISLETVVRKSETHRLTLTSEFSRLDITKVQKTILSLIQETDKSITSVTIVGITKSFTLEKISREFSNIFLKVVNDVQKTIVTDFQQINIVKLSQKLLQETTRIKLEFISESNIQSTTIVEKSQMFSLTLKKAIISTDISKIESAFKAEYEKTLSKTNLNVKIVKQIEKITESGETIWEILHVVSEESAVTGEIVIIDKKVTKAISITNIKKILSSIIRSDSTKTYESLVETSVSKVALSVAIKETFKTIIDKRIDITNIETRTKFEQVLLKSFKETVSIVSTQTTKLILKSIDVTKISTETLIKNLQIENIVTAKKEKISIQSFEDLSIIRKSETLSVFVKKAFSKSDIEIFQKSISKTWEKINIFTIVKIISTWSYVSVTGETLTEVIYSTHNLSTNSTSLSVISAQTMTSINIETLETVIKTEKTRLQYEFISKEILEKTETYLESNIFEFTLSTALKEEDILTFEETVGITLQEKLEGCRYSHFNLSLFIGNLQISSIVKEELVAKFIRSVEKTSITTTNQYSLGLSVFVLQVSLQTKTGIVIDSRVVRNLLNEEVKEAINLSETGTNVTYSERLVEIKEKTKLISRNHLFGITFQQKVSDTQTERTKLEQVFKETLSRQNTEYTEISVKFAYVEEVFISFARSVFIVHFTVETKSEILRVYDLKEISITIVKQIIKEKKITSIKEEEYSIVDISKEKIIRRVETFSLTLRNQFSIADKQKIVEILKKTTRATSIELISIEEKITITGLTVTSVLFIQKSQNGLIINPNYVVKTSIEEFKKELVKTTFTSGLIYTVFEETTKTFSEKETFSFALKIGVREVDYTLIENKISTFIKTVISVTTSIQVKILQCVESVTETGEVVYKTDYVVMTSGITIDSRTIREFKTTEIQTFLQVNIYETKETYWEKFVSIQKTSIIKRMNLQTLTVSSQLTQVTIKKITDILLLQYQKVFNFISVTFIKLESCFIENGEEAFIIVYKVENNSTIIRKIDNIQVTFEKIKVQIEMEDIKTIKNTSLTLIDETKMKITRRLETSYIKIKEKVSREDYSKFELIIKNSLKITESTTVVVKVLRTEERITITGETVILLIYSVKRKSLLVHSQLISIEQTSLIQKRISETVFISKRIYTVSQVKLEESINIKELFSLTCKMFIKHEHRLIIEENIAKEYKEEYKLDVSVKILVKIVKIIEEFTETGEIIYKTLYNIVIGNKRINSRLIKNVSVTRIKKIFELSTQTSLYSSFVVDITKTTKIFRRSELHQFSSIQSIEDKTAITSLIKESLKILNYLDVQIKIIKFEENIFEGRSVFTCYYSVVRKNVYIRNIDIRRITKETLTQVSINLNILSVKKEKITFVQTEKIIRRIETLSISIRNTVSIADFEKIQRVIKKSLEERNAINVNIKIIGIEEYITETSETVTKLIYTATTLTSTTRINLQSLVEFSSSIFEKYLKLELFLNNRIYQLEKSSIKLIRIDKTFSFTLKESIKLEDYVKIETKLAIEYSKILKLQVKVKILRQIEEFSENGVVFKRIIFKIESLDKKLIDKRKTVEISNEILQKSILNIKIAGSITKTYSETLITNIKTSIRTENTHNFLIDKTVSFESEIIKKQWESVILSSWKKVHSDTTDIELKILGTEIIYKQGKEFTQIIYKVFNKKTQTVLREIDVKKIDSKVIQQNIDDVKLTTINNEKITVFASSELDIREKTTFKLTLKTQIQESDKQKFVQAIKEAVISSNKLVLSENTTSAIFDISKEEITKSGKIVATVSITVKRDSKIFSSQEAAFNISTVEELLSNITVTGTDEKFSDVLLSAKVAIEHQNIINKKENIEMDKLLSLTVDKTLKINEENKLAEIVKKLIVKENTNIAEANLTVEVVRQEKVIDKATKETKVKVKLAIRVNGKIKDARLLKISKEKIQEEINKENLNINIKSIDKEIRLEKCMKLLIKNVPLANEDVDKAIKTLQDSLRESDAKYKDGIVTLCTTRQIINEKSETLTEILYEVSINNKTIVQSVDKKTIIKNFKEKKTIKKEEFKLVIQNEKTEIIDFESTFKLYSLNIFSRASYTQIIASINQVWKTKLQSVMTTDVDFDIKITSFNEVFERKVSGPFKIIYEYTYTLSKKTTKELISALRLEKLTSNELDEIFTSIDISFKFTGNVENLVSKMNLFKLTVKQYVLESQYTILQNKLEEFWSEDSSFNSKVATLRIVQQQYFLTSERETVSVLFILATDNSNAIIKSKDFPNFNIQALTIKFESLTIRSSKGTKYLLMETDQSKLIERTKVYKFLLKKSIKIEFVSSLTTEIRKVFVQMKKGIVREEDIKIELLQQEEYISVSDKTTALASNFLVLIADSVLDSRLDLITDSDLEDILTSISDYKDSLVRKIEEGNYIRFDSLFTILTEVRVEQTTEITNEIKKHWQTNLQTYTVDKLEIITQEEVILEKSSTFAFGVFYLVKTDKETLDANKIDVKYTKLQEMISKAEIIYQGTTYKYKIVEMELFTRTTVTKTILIEREEIDKDSYEVIEKSLEESYKISNNFFVDKSIEIIVKDEYISLQGISVIKLFYKVLQENKVSILAESFNEISHSDIQQQLKEFKVFTSNDKLFRYKKKFSFVLERFVLKDNVGTIQLNLNKAWEARLQTNTIYFVKQEEVLNDNGKIFYQSSYFVENTATNTVLDSIVWGELEENIIEEALDVQVQNLQDKYKDFLVITSNATELIRWKDAFSIMTIVKISKQYHDDIKRALTNMWRNIRKLSVDIHIFPNSEKYVQESGNIIHKLFYKVKESSKLLKASNLGNFEDGENQENFKNVIVTNNQQLSSLLFKSTSGELYRIKSTFNFQLSRSILKTDEVNINTQLQTIWKASNSEVSTVTILAREEFIIKSNLESLYKIYYLVKTDNKILDAVFNSDIESQKIRDALDAVTIGQSSNKYSEFFQTYLASELIPFDDLMSLALRQTVIKTDYIILEEKLKEAWVKKTSLSDVEIKIVGQERYTLDKLFVSKILYTFTRNQVIYTPIDLEMLTKVELSAIEEIDSANGEKYSIIDSSENLIRFKKAQFIYLDNYIKLNQMDKIIDIISNVIQDNTIEIQLGPSEEFIHPTKKVIIRLSYFSFISNLVIDGRLRPALSTQRLQTELDSLKLKIVVDTTNYINEVQTATLMVIGIPSRTDNKIIAGLQAVASGLLPGSTAEIINYQPYISQTGLELTGIFYKITLNGEIQNPKLLKIPEISSDDVYKGKDVLKLNKLYKLSLTGLILNGDTQQMIKQVTFVGSWTEYLQKNRLDLQISFYKADVNFGLFGEIVTNVLYSVESNGFIYHPAIQDPVPKSTSFRQAIKSIVPETSLFDESRTLIRRDRTFSLTFERTLTSDDIEKITNELQAKWTTIEALDESPKIIGISDRTDETMGKSIVQVYYIVKKNGINIEVTDVDGPTDLPSFPAFDQPTVPVESLYISGRVNDSSTNNIQTVLETTWRRATNVNDLKVKLTSVNSKFTSVEWKKVTLVKYAVESEQKGTPGRDSIEGGLGTFGLRLCNCVAQKERKLVLKAERADVVESVVSESIQAAWENKNSEVNGTFEAKIKIDQSRKKRAATGGSGLTVDNGTAITPISDQVTLDSMPPHPLLIKEPTPQEIDDELKKRSNNVEVCHGVCKPKICRFMNVKKTESNNIEDVKLAIQEAYVEANPGMEKSDFEVEITQVQELLDSNGLSYSKVNYCVSTKDGSIPQEPTDEQLNRALKKYGFELFDAEVTTEKPGDVVEEGDLKWIITAGVLCGLFALIFLILAIVKIWMRSKRLQRQKSREQDREYLHDEEFYPKSRNGTFATYNTLHSTANSS